MATVVERLAEAEAKLHDLELGQAEVEVRDADGRSVRYTPATAAHLRAYIAQLRREAGGARRGRAIGFRF
ncbi:MAG: gpW family head-tail joining protein [Tistlia sp.]|uniref:gpW family head-tail joining protein n=1 Tax=Tistlia sp. TaxID=3057121 RepID=UPI0034A2342E